MHPDTKRFVLATLLAPLAVIPAGVLMGIVGELFFTSSEALDLEGFLAGIYIIGVLGGVIAFIAMIIVGLPAIFILQKLKIYNLLTLSTMSLIGAYLTWEFFFYSYEWKPLLMFCYFSLAVSTTWWAINRPPKLSNNEKV